MADTTPGVAAKKDVGPGSSFRMESGTVSSREQTRIRDMKVVEAYKKEAVPVKVLAERFNMRLSTVYNVLRKNRVAIKRGVLTRYNEKKREALKKKSLELILKGRTASEVMKETGINRTNLMEIMDRQRLFARNSHPVHFLSGASLHEAIRNDIRDGIHHLDTMMRLKISYTSYMTAVYEADLTGNPDIYDPGFVKRCIEDYHNGMSAMDIAEAVGCSCISIRKILRRNGVMEPAGSNIVPVDDDACFHDYKSGMTVREVSKKHGKSLHVIRKALKRKGVSFISRQGSYIKDRELKRRNAEIAETYFNKKTRVTEIARKHGISRQGVYNAIKKHMEQNNLTKTC